MLVLGRGPILLLRVVDLVETGQHSPLAALMKVEPVESRRLPPARLDRR